MIKLYSDLSLSSRKAKKWLKRYNLPFIEIKTNIKGMSKEEIIEVLALSDNGISDILSKRSRLYKKLEIEGSNYCVTEILDLIQENPILLKNPIVLDKRKVQFGFHEDELRKFLPRDFRAEKRK